MEFNILKQNKTFGGITVVAEHASTTVKTAMKFSYFLPAPVEAISHAIIWLSGLTCNEENFITKAGVQGYLAGTNTMIICPDTSPRGLHLPGEHDTYDFGSGAGFYINATTEGYKEHYQMYDYISKELYALIKGQFKVKTISIMGHSMGGHGALVLGLREPEKFIAISAFSPIVNPTVVPWGKKAFMGYLGDDTELWRQYDATDLVNNGKTSQNSILIDQGTDDEFLEKQLLTENFVTACNSSSQNIELHYRKGYDHSYFFIASFIEQHVAFHRAVTPA